MYVYDASSDLMTELARREKEAGIRPEPEVDLFMKVGRGTDCEEHACMHG